MTEMLDEVYLGMVLQDLRSHCVYIGFLLQLYYSCRIQLRAVALATVIATCTDIHAYNG